MNPVDVGHDRPSRAAHLPSASLPQPAYRYVHRKSGSAKKPVSAPRYRAHQNNKRVCRCGLLFEGCILGSLIPRNSP